MSNADTHIVETGPPSETTRYHAWHMGSGLFMQALTDANRLEQITAQIRRRCTENKCRPVMLGRGYDARTGIYADLGHPSVALVVSQPVSKVTLRPIIFVGKAARNSVAWIEDDGSITVSDCGHRTTATTAGIEWAVGRVGVGRVAGALCALGFVYPDTSRSIQIINSTRGPIL